MIICMKANIQEETKLFRKILLKKTSEKHTGVVFLCEKLYKYTKNLNLDFIFCTLCDIVFNYIQFVM